MGYPCGQVRSAVPPPSSLFILTGEVGEKQKTRLCVSTAQQELKYPSFITLSNTNPNHSRILATVKKINSTQAKTSTFGVTCFIQTIACCDGGPISP